MRSIDVQKAKEVETRMYEARQLFEGGKSLKNSNDADHAVGQSPTEPIIITPVNGTVSEVGDRNNHERN
jgi:hypothetical protein